MEGRNEDDDAAQFEPDEQHERGAHGDRGGN